MYVPPSTSHFHTSTPYTSSLISQTPPLHLLPPITHISNSSPSPTPPPNHSYLKLLPFTYSPQSLISQTPPLHLPLPPITHISNSILPFTYPSPQSLISQTPPLHLLPPITHISNSSPSPQSLASQTPPLHLPLPPITHISNSSPSPTPPPNHSYLKLLPFTYPSPQSLTSLYMSQVPSPVNSRRQRHNLLSKYLQDCEHGNGRTGTGTSSPARLIDNKLNALIQECCECRVSPLYHHLTWISLFTAFCGDIRTRRHHRRQREITVCVCVCVCKFK